MEIVQEKIKVMEEGECSPLALDDASGLDGGESTSPVGASTGDGMREIFGSDRVVLRDSPPLTLLPTLEELHAVIKERERVPAHQ